MKSNKMLKKALYSLSFLLLLGSCSTCDKEKPATCSEQPPTDEPCLAYFNRWFYDESSNSCQLIGYGGCSEYGFATEQECEACVCD